MGSARQRRHGSKSVVIAALALAVFISQPTYAAEECDGFRGDEAILTGELLGIMQKLRLPSRGDVDDALAKLDNTEEGPAGYAIDLNRDGRAEYLLTSNGALCGNAGCPYVLLDPKTLKTIGDFFGHLAILDERFNGYRIIQSYSRLHASLTNLNTYAFDRGAYRLVSHITIDSCGLEQWQRRMRRPK